MGQSFACSSNYLDPRIVSFVESQIQSTKILVVSKTSCSACTRAKQLLRGLAYRTGINPSVFEVDKYALQCTKGIMKYISAQTGINTVPQIYINGRFVGGNDAIQRLHLEGRLVPLILKEINVSPSMTSAANVNGFGYKSFNTAPSLRVAAFKTSILPVPTFETLMPTNTTIRTMNDMKSEDFIYNGSNIGASNRSRSFSMERKSSVPSTDLEILRRPARVASTPTFRSSILWSGEKSNSLKNTSPSLSDEEILAQPVFFSQVKQSSRVRSSIGRRAPEFSTIENPWLSNSRREFPATIATPERDSRVVKKPVNRGTSGWICMSSKII